MEEQDSGELLREYNGLYQSYDDICHDIALAAGLSVTAFQILYYLLENGDGCLQRDICAITYTSKQTIHSAIQRLRDQGILCLRPGGSWPGSGCCRPSGWSRPSLRPLPRRRAGSCCA